MLEKIKQDICLIEEVGVAKMENFIQERIKMESEYLGNNAKGSASNLVCLFKNAYETISNNVLELKEDRVLFAIIIANSRTDMHLQECLSNYELSIVPRLLFPADGTMLHCSAKSKLMDILERCLVQRILMLHLLIYYKQTNVLR